MAEQGWYDPVTRLVHWFDQDGNEHVNGMGVIIPDEETE